MLKQDPECTEYLCACFCWPENMAGVYILNKNLWVKGVKGFIGKYQTLLQRGGENLNMNQWEEPRDRADGEASSTTMYQLAYIHLLEVSA